MKTPTLVNLNERPFTRLIDRRTKWGNPYFIGPDGTRQQVIAKHREYLKTQPELLAALPELGGQVLGCHCAPRACHGETLIALCQLSPSELQAFTQSPPLIEAPPRTKNHWSWRR